MKRYKSSDYLYISGLIKTRERFLLTEDKVEKMIESKTPDDALKVLYELDYGFPNDEIPAEKFETLLSRELLYTYNLILSLAPEPEYFSIFLYPNDYHNVKALLKAEFLNISPEGLFHNPGSISVEELTELVRDRDYGKMRAAMAHGIREAVEKYGKSRDPQIVDIILDRACGRDINTKVDETKNEYLKKYITLRFDIINLKSFARVKRMNKPFKFYNSVFLEGGDIPISLYEDHYDEEFDIFEESLMKYGFQTFFHEGTSMSERVKSFAVFEKLCDNLLMDFIRETRHIAFGIQPIINYIVAKESEIKSARIIMTAKLAGLPDDIIWERIRHYYV